MKARISRKLVLASVGAFALFMPPATGAQGRPAPTLELAVGSLLFPDDGIVREGFAGAAVRLYVLPRVSVGPEMAFVQGSHHSHLMVTGNVTCDLLPPASGRPRPVTPFVVAGGGLFQTRENFLNQDFTSKEGAFTAGGGVRASLGHRVSAGFESRVGWELHVRVNGFVGVRLGR